MKRKSISASVRWSVFARDGFACRYCGASATEDGVSLHVDHAVSVADGGDNSFDNLVSACQECNGGKGARSLRSVPNLADTLNRLTDRTEGNDYVADAIREYLKSKRELEQEVVNLKCAAYSVEQVYLAPNETTAVFALIDEFGAAAVAEWYECAAANNVHAGRCVPYLRACARNTREKAGVVA